MPAAVEFLPVTDWEVVSAAFCGYVDPFFDIEPGARLVPLHRLLQAA